MGQWVCINVLAKMNMESCCFQFSINESQIFWLLIRFLLKILNRVAFVHSSTTLLYNGMKWILIFLVYAIKTIRLLQIDKGGKTFNPGYFLKFYRFIFPPYIKKNLFAAIVNALLLNYRSYQWSQQQHIKKKK